MTEPYFFRGVYSRYGYIRIWYSPWIIWRSTATRGTWIHRAIINFFEISQQLLFDAVYQIASKYIDTPLFKKFLKNCDALLDIGGDFVNKKMMELKEMAEKGIDPAKTEGVLVALLFIQNKFLV